MNSNKIYFRLGGGGGGGGLGGANGNYFKPTI